MVLRLGVLDQDSLQGFLWGFFHMLVDLVAVVDCIEVVEVAAVCLEGCPYCYLGTVVNLEVCQHWRIQPVLEVNSAVVL